MVRGFRGAWVRLAGVTAGYGNGEPVLRGVSATLTAGRLTAVVGPNAAGKSTLLRVMLGQVRPTAGAGAGAVEVGGEPVERLRGVELARRLAYVPQRGGSSFGFTVRETVAMGRFAFGDERGVDEAIAALGLESVAGRPFGELSGGQQQRVLVARAWAQAGGGQPGVTEVGLELPGAGGFLADEPTSSLDVGRAEGVMRLLRGLADRGWAVGVVLHSLDAAARWADEAWLLDGRGGLRAGPVEEVLTPGVLGPVYGVELEAVEHAGRRLFVAVDVGAGLKLPGAGLPFPGAGGDTLGGGDRDATGGRDG
ncbi:MAG: ABC transporter ATP-binding protein [Planctomycetota bacterium]